jgi:lysophospholipase L1-like esterase
MIKIATVGDSNTAGGAWQAKLFALLEEHYSNIFSLVLSAAAGATTVEMVGSKPAGGLVSADHLMPTALTANPDIVCLMCGTNDPWRFSAPDMYVGYDFSLEGFAGRIRTMIDMVYATSGPAAYGGRPLLILMSTPPLASYTDGYQNGYDQAFWATYRNVIYSLATEYNLPLADVFAKITAVPNWNTHETGILYDGVHFTQKGYDLIGEAVFDVIPQYIDMLLSSPPPGPDPTGTRLVINLGGGQTFTLNETAGGRLKVVIEGQVYSFDSDQMFVMQQY